MHWLEIAAWAAAAAALAVVGVLASMAFKCWRIHSVIVSQLPGSARVLPFDPLSGMGVMRAMKTRPAGIVRHGARSFPASMELAIESVFPSKDGAGPLLSRPDLEKIPMSAGRDVVGPPSAGPSMFFFGPSQRLQISDEDVVRDVLVTKARAFHKPATMKRYLGRLLGTSSLLLSEGDTHRVQRRIVAKAFVYDLLQGMVPTMGRCSEAAVRLLTPDAGAPPEQWLFVPGSKGTRNAEIVPDDGTEVPVPERFRDSPVLDASAAMSGLTLEIIAHSAFGGAFGSAGADAPDAAGKPEAAGAAPVPGSSSAARVVINALEAGMADTFALVSRYPIAVVFPLLEPLAWRKETATASAARQRLFDLTQEVIERRRRRASGGEKDAGTRDLLDLVIGASASAEELRGEASAAYTTGADATEDAPSARPAGGGGAGSRAKASPPSSSDVRLSDREVQDQAVTFVLAGHETTSQLLTWTVYCLAQAPEWQGRLRDEARAFLAGHADASAAFAGAKDLHRRLPLNHAVLREVLRLYPPASIVVRRVAEDVTVGDGGRLRLPEGVNLVVPIAAMHRKASVFADPDDFDPCRWLDDDQVRRLGMKRAGPDGLEPGQDAANWARPEVGAISPYKFLPFSAGARNCIGQRFALLEARIALAALSARAEWFLDNAYRHCPSIRITTQAMFGMPVRFRRSDE